MASKNAFGRSSTRLRALQAVVQDFAISGSVVLSLIETLTMRITNGPILFTSRVWWIVSDGEWDADKWLPKIISTQKLPR